MSTDRSRELEFIPRVEMPGSWAGWHPDCGWYPVTDPWNDAPDGAEVEWPDFGPGVWRRSGDRWYPASAGVL